MEQNAVICHSNVIFNYFCFEFLLCVTIHKLTNNLCMIYLHLGVLFF